VAIFQITPAVEWLENQVIYKLPILWYEDGGTPIYRWSADSIAPVFSAEYQVVLLRRHHPMISFKDDLESGTPSFYGPFAHPGWEEWIP